MKRKLGFWAVFCIAAGAMISSGLFVLPGLAFEQSGPAVIIAYAIASLLVIPAMLAQAELASAMPRSGGTYFFIERSMGALPGTLAGLANWLSIALKAAFALIGIGAFARLVWPGGQIGEWTIKLIAMAFCLLFTVPNILSVKGTGRLQIIMVAILLAVLGVFVVTGMPAVRHANFENFLGKGWGNVFATVGLVFVSFGGLTKVTSIAGEVHKPGRNIVGGMVLAWAIVSALYIATVFVVVGVAGRSELAGNLTPLSLAAGQFMGTGGKMLLAFGAMLAFVTTGNSGILTASRSPMAMSRDGLLPAAMQKMSRRFGTPYVSILATSGFMIIIIAVLSVKGLVEAASTMMLILFVLVNVAVLVMRGSKIQNYRPLYRVPLVPWIPLAGIAMLVFLIVQMTMAMDPLPLITTAVFVLAGILWYFFYVRPSISRESALVYMVRSAVSKDFYRSTLEEELKQIAFDRDEVVHDRFDELIHRCDILDLPASLSADEMFSRAAEALSGRTAVEAGRLRSLLTDREAASSTVIEPGLAIPHIIVDGEKVFEILPIRCREGVVFPGQAEPVRVVFILAGSRDERNFHLRTLMAIAQIVQEQHFQRRWMDAPDAEQLRDVLLLSGRKRDVHPPGSAGKKG